MSEPKHLTGAEHFAAAEWCLEKAEGVSDPATVQAWAAIAQVHATLALAAAGTPAVPLPANKPHPAMLAPAPKGYACPVCNHSINVHREHGCDVADCDCPAPYGRVMPGDPA